MISNAAFLCVCVVASCTRFAIDVNDILSEELMPSNLLMLENPTGGVRSTNDTKGAEDLDGTLDDAVKTMGFHRNMMNQYLCRSYVAEQIVSEMSAFRVRRRMGHFTPGVGEGRLIPTKFQINVKDNLMHDEGSSAYKDWLTKSTTLEDIYRHYNQEANNKVDIDTPTEEGDGDKNEDFDEAVVSHVSPHKTGAPYTSMKHRGEEVYYASDGGYPYQYQQGSAQGVYGSSAHSGGGASYAVHEPSVEHVYDDAPHEQEHIYHTYHNPPKYQGHYESHGKDKDLTELFEVALTALAYLSFGLFIVHVIMCISSVTNNSTTTPNAMPMSMSPTATGTGMTGTGGGDTGTGGGGGGGTDDGTGGGEAGTDEGTGEGGGGGDDGTGGGGGGETGAEDGGDDGTGGGGGDTGTGTGGGGDASTATGGGGDDGTGTGGGGDAGTGTGGGGDAGTGTGGGGDAGTGTGGGGDAGTGTGGGGDAGTGTGGGGDGGTGGGGDDAAGGGDTTATTGGVSPGSGTGTASEDSGDVRDSINFKMKRDIPTITNPDTKVLNELARRILTSIDAAVMANEDDGECLRKSLCENNKWSKSLSGRNRLIVPIWSVGMSWLSGRLVKSIPSPTAMLDSLKSTMLGLGNANCEMMYRNCEYRTRKAEGKRSRRKKRNTSKRK